MNHTPGPWKSYESSERSPFPAGCPVEVGTEVGRGAKTGTICEINAQGDGKYEPAVTAANAYLIAAAPDLLEACRLTLELFASLPNSKHSGRIVQIADLIEAAIEKAGGL